MDFYLYSLQSLVVLALFWTVIRGEQRGACDLDPSVYDSDGLFEVYTFEAAEGILLQKRKLIGTIPLDGNSSNGYKFDEPYFKKPTNFKTEARPQHFNVNFINISSTIEDATTRPPRKEHTTAYTTRFMPTTEKTSYQFSDGSYKATSGSGHLAQNKSADYSYAGTTWNEVMVTSSTMGVTSTNVTSVTETSTPSQIEPRECGGAQIFQIYDLDREKADTHYLAISNYEEDWGIPILVVVKVTDINDNNPIFVKDSLHTQITPDVTMGDVVAHVQATDADIGINADLRYQIISSTERRGNETESPEMPTFLIHRRFGIVTLFNDISDLKPPSKITFSVVVNDHGDSHVANRATATVTISIVDSLSASTVNPATESNQISGGVVAGCVMGGVVFFGLILFIGIRLKRSRVNRRDAQLQFMMDDENLISA